MDFSVFESLLKAENLKEVKSSGKLINSCFAELSPIIHSSLTFNLVKSGR
jgi:hypothetical protein